MQHRRLRGEAGVSSTELAVLMPALLLLVLIPAQIGMWFHARHSAAFAAEEALDAAQVATASPADGERVARWALGQSGNLADINVAVDRDTTTVTVDVTANLAFSVLPGPWKVHATATGPVEQYLAEEDR